MVILLSINSFYFTSIKELGHIQHTNHIANGKESPTKERSENNEWL